VHSPGPRHSASESLLEDAHASKSPARTFDTADGLAGTPTGRPDRSAADPDGRGPETGHERCLCGHTAAVSRKAVVVAAILLPIGIAALGHRVEQVHSETGEWRLSPSAAPPRLHVDGHDYARAGRAPELPKGTIDVSGLGTNDGGGFMYRPPMAKPTGPVPTVIHVYDDETETTWAYRLIGGN
jgi:hypothetical protein